MKKAIKQGTDPATKLMKMAIILLLAVFGILSMQMKAAADSHTNEFPLWTNAAPGALGTSSNDIPTLTPFLPETDKASGAAVIVCPGGGYRGLAAHEGAGYGQWLALHGIAAFVLKYRLGSHGYHHPIMLEDVSRALRSVRSGAVQWGVDPNKIGVMGSSAGGHLASTLLTHFDIGESTNADPIERMSSRPDFGILCYPVITLENPYAHVGSRNALLGTNATSELVTLLSNEKQVTKDTPPCFIWHTWEDPGVKVENSLMFAMALREHGVPFDLHIYQNGGHGMGLGKSSTEPDKLHPWTDDLLYWLEKQGYVKSSYNAVSLITKKVKP